MLAKVAILQLYPENASQSIRIEALAHAINCIPYIPGKPKVSRHKLSQILNEPPLGKGDIQSQEDPASNAFTEAFTFFGGSYIVFPGQISEPTFNLKNLNHAIFHSEEFFSHKDFRKKIYAMNLGILALSNILAHRMGLERNMLPVIKSRSIYVPNDIDQKTSIVTFPLAELEELLDSFKIGYKAIEPFIQDFGLLSSDSYSFQNSPLHSRPLIRFEDQIIVAEPWMLLATLRQHILLVAKEYNLLDLLFTAYTTIVLHSIDSSLHRLGYKETGYKFDQPKLDIEIQESVWYLDTDKALYVAAVFDDFRDFVGDEVFEVQNDRNQGEIIDDRLSSVEQKLYADAINLGGVFYLIIQVGIGRSTVMGLNFDKTNKKAIATVLSANELNILSVLFPSDRFLLYKFAKAQQAILDSTKVIAWSALDEFSIYRDNHFSFYLSDDARPTLINIAPGSGLGIIKEYLDKVDIHAVRSYRSNGWFEVENYYRHRSCPIFTPINFNPSEIALVVELPNTTIWVTANVDYEKESRISEKQNPFAFVDIISYWLWQFYIICPDCFSQINLDNPLHFEVLINQENNEDESIKKTPLVATCFPSNNKMEIHISPEVVNLINTPDNSGELEIVNYVLRGLSVLLTTNGWTEQAGKIQDQLHNFIELEKSSPRKKKVLSIDPSINPTMLPGNPITFRKIQEADTSNVLDDEGDFIKREFQLSPGPIPNSQHVFTLNKIVEFLFMKLASMIDDLYPEHLLDFLVTHYEAIIFQRSNRRLTIPTQLACFSSSKELVEQLIEELPEIDDAALSCRFLIEYVVAQPPTGKNPISFEVYDQLMALSSEIIARANQSDMAKYGLFNFDFAFLESGRLGFNRSEFNSKVNTFQNHRSADEIYHAGDNFARWWKERPEIEPKDFPLEVKELNQAFEAEFGIMFSDLTLLISELGNLSLDVSQAQYKTMEFSTLVEQLSKTLHWNQDKTLKIVNFLSLEPRDEFLNPPNPFLKTDVYPWRMSRGLSYLRRPLLIVINNGYKNVCWGVRHLFASSDYLLQAVVSGRLQDRYISRAMQDFIGKNSTKKGEEFNQRVFDSCALIPGVISRKKVKAISGKRIGYPDKDLGDIDVMAFFPNKRIIAVIECKDLGIARNAIEMSHELEVLFTGNSKKEATITKHKKRSEWIKDNLPSVLDSVGIHDKTKWKVEPILVVGSEMMTSAFHKSTIPVYQVDRFISEYLSRYM